MASISSTKDKILELLKKQTKLTVGELARSLGITEMAVRKHLAVLDRDSLLAVHEVRQPMGRPIQVFSLSERADDLFPKNYEKMTVEFLHDLEELLGPEIIDYLLEKRSERQKNSYLPKMQKKTFEEKLEELKTIQNSKGYMAELHKVEDHSYEFIEYNCPIYKVAQEYKHACSCETNMFKQVLGTESVKRLACKTENSDHCRFLMKETPIESRQASHV